MSLRTAIEELRSTLATCKPTYFKLAAAAKALRSDLSAETDDEFTKIVLADASEEPPLTLLIGLASREAHELAMLGGKLIEMSDQLNQLADDIQTRAERIAKEVGGEMT